MKNTLPIIALIAAGACSSAGPDLHLADYADAGSTALVIAQGGVEMNPIIGVAGDTAAPVFAGDYPTQIGEPVTKTCCDNPGPETEIDTSSSDKADLVKWAIALVGAAILLNTRKQSDPNAPRQNVRPEMCMEKVAGVDVMVACDD